MRILFIKQHVHAFERDIIWMFVELHIICQFVLKCNVLSRLPESTHELRRFATAFCQNRDRHSVQLLLAKDDK